MCVLCTMRIELIHRFKRQVNNTVNCSHLFEHTIYNLMQKWYLSKQPILPWCFQFFLLFISFPWNIIVSWYLHIYLYSNALQFVKIDWMFESCLIYQTDEYHSSSNTQSTGDHCFQRIELLFIRWISSIERSISTN